ncbi:MAG: hypothetical protein RL199_1254 [Pseudomonadota bacterium]|jgi:hypothetical protein
MRRFVTARVAGGLGALVLASTSGARADDLSASVFTESNFELRRDDRLLALFTAFNVAGLDRAEYGRAEPFPKKVWHPVRTQVLGSIGTATADKLRPGLESFIQAHPAPMQRWLEAALSLNESDLSAAAPLPTALAGLDGWLQEFVKNARLAKVEAAVAGDYRTALKALRPAVDGPFARLRAAFGLAEETAPALLLLPTPLDAAGQAWALKTADGFHAVVFGLPVEAPLDPAPLLAAYARLLAADAAGGATSKAVEDALSQLKAKGLALEVADGRALVAESYAAAALAHTKGKDGAGEVDAAMRRGLVLARAFAKALEEPAAAPSPAKGTLTEQVVQKFDGKKAVAEAVSVGGRK